MEKPPSSQVQAVPAPAAWEVVAAGGLEGEARQTLPRWLGFTLGVEETPGFTYEWGQQS